jgi:predicted metal-dependent peptidase
MGEIGSIKVNTDSNKWPKLSLTPLQTRLWMETRTALLINQPAFADVWFRMMQDKDRELAWFTDQIPTAATNDQFMFINPETFFKYNLQHRVFIACHEITHAIFNHCGSMYRLQELGYIIYPDSIKLPYKSETMQIAMDCLINDMLIRGKVGEAPKDCCHAPNLITYQDDLTTAYRKLYKKPKTSTNPQSNGQGDGQGQRFDEHLQPGQGTGKSPAQAQDARNPQAWDNALSAALASAKAQGRLPATLERGLSKLLEPQVDWREHLAVTMSRRLGADFSTWNTLDNELMLRGIGSPSKVKYGCETIVFAVDTSGSINQKTMDMFCTEGIGLMEQARPRSLIFVQCDAAVQEWVELDTPDDMMREIKGGGGTSFVPVFERLAREGVEPEVLIYLTDLMGTFPSEAPGYPVIWCTIYDSAVPFGDKVLLPEQSQ